jgi:hypothetical protein
MELTTYHTVAIQLQRLVGKMIFLGGIIRVLCASPVDRPRKQFTARET